MISQTGGHGDYLGPGRHGTYLKEPGYTALSQTVPRRFGNWFAMFLWLVRILSKSAPAVESHL